MADSQRKKAASKKKATKATAKKKVTAKKAATVKAPNTGQEGKNSIFTYLETI